MTTTDPLANFKETLAKRIAEGEKHGVPEKVMKEGMVNLADLLVNFAKPDTPEEALIKEMWELANENEKRVLTDLVFRVGKKAVH